MTESPKQFREFDEKAIIQQILAYPTSFIRFTNGPKTYTYIEMSEHQKIVIEFCKWQHQQAQEKIRELELVIANLKMTCRRLSAAKSIESRDKISKQCLNIFNGNITRNIKE